MGSRGESKDEDTGSGVAEARNGTSPVGLVLVGSTLGFSDSLAVGAETRTAFAGDDGFTGPEKGKGERFDGSACHCIP